MTEFSTIGVTINGAVARITIDRPQVLNAMNSLALTECLAALRQAEGDPAVRVLVLSGRGDRAFTAGADISEIARFGPAEMANYNQLWINWFAALEASRLVVIASVAGWATGGGTEMTLACDIVIAADTAKFGLAEINIGVIPGAGAAVRLTRWVGRLRAKQLLMTGDPISAAQAVEWHLATEMVPASELSIATDRWANRLSVKAPLALAAAKHCVNVAAEAELPNAISHELREFLLLFATADQKEGMAAFLEKRRPVFEGR